MRIAKPPPFVPEARAFKKTESFYGSAEWKAFRDAVIKERGRCCQKCGKTTGKMYVDHIREIKDGGAKLDRANSQVLCAPCHTSKTIAAKAAREARRLAMR